MMVKKENIWALLSATGFLLLSGCQTTSYTTREVVSYDGAHYVVGQCSLTEEDSSSIKQQAENGDAEAQFNLGAWYDSSCGGHDTSEGAKWCLRAAEQGNRQAQYKIAGRYFYGVGVTEDIEEAERWYRKAAEQGDAVAARTLGDLYNITNYKPRDLDEAEKWYRLAIKNGDSFSRNRLDQLMRQKDPEAWTEEKRETKEKLRLAAEAKAERIRLEVEAKTRVTAREAIARFGLVSVIVIETEESKQYRAEVRRKMESLPELREDVAIESEYNLLELLLGGILAIPIGGPLAVIGPLLEEANFDVGQYSYKALQERAKVRAAIATLTETFARQNLEKGLTEALLATAARQQAANLLVSDSDNAAGDAPHRLEVRLEELRMVARPGRRFVDLLWAATEAKLTSRDSPAIQKRFCYGGSFSLVGAANDALGIQEYLNRAYQNLSNQILSEMLGLAPDPDAPGAWNKTAKMCSVQTFPIEISGGHYIGEMKDGKRHGYGEMRYQAGDWVSIYRGYFVNDKEHGDGRCRWKSGGWSTCTFANGKRM